MQFLISICFSFKLSRKVFPHPWYGIIAAPPHSRREPAENSHQTALQFKGFHGRRHGIASNASGYPHLLFSNFWLTPKTGKSLLGRIPKPLIKTAPPFIEIWNPKKHYPWENIKNGLAPYAGKKEIPWLINLYVHVKMKLYDWKESRMWFSDWYPLVLRKRVVPMSVMEVLTLLLVVFTALSYIDNHKKK